MSNALSCHQETCSEFLGKEIRDLISKRFHGVIEVEPVVLQEDEDSQNDSPASIMAIDKPATFAHRFLVTVTERCQPEDGVICSLPPNNHRDDNGLCDNIANLDALFDSGELDVSILDNETLGLSSEPDFDAGRHEEPTGAVSAIQFADTSDTADRQSNNDTELICFENIVDADESSATLDVLNMANDAATSMNVRLYPLDTGKIFEVINERLDKTSPPQPSDWNSLLEEVTTMTCVKDAACDPHPQIQNEGQTSASTTVMMKNEMALSQLQQQSNVPSSTSWNTIAISTPHHQSTNMIPQIGHQNYYLNQTGLSSNADQFNLAMSSAPQQTWCPANLPAVSALISGGANGGKSLNWTFSTQSTIPPTTMQQRHEGNGICRPSVLLPKSLMELPSKKSPYVDVKSRTRKTSPLLKSVAPKTTAAEPTYSQFPSTFQTNVPEGHTYESWIIQEGLIKVRQKLKEERKAEGYRRQPRKTENKQQEVLQEDTQTVKIRVAKKVKTAARYGCPVCEKSYSSANGLKYHAENGHGPKTIFTCEICQKEYASRHGLVAHRRGHEIRARAEALELERLQQK